MFLGKQPSKEDSPREPARSASRWARGVWTLLLTAVLVGGVWLILSIPVEPWDSGNPRNARTPEERARAETTRAEMRYLAKRRRFWVEQVEAGEISFEEAGCGYRGGEWSFERNRCEDILTGEQRR